MEDSLIREIAYDLEGRGIEIGDIVNIDDEDLFWLVRRALGTEPSDFITQEQQTDFSRDQTDIRVKMCYAPDLGQVTKVMHALVTGTWGEYPKDVTSKSFKPTAAQDWVVKYPVLLGMTQPQVLEIPTFVFSVTGAPRSTMDQLFRTRIGAGFSAQGERDNDARMRNFVVPQSATEDQRDIIKQAVTIAKLCYSSLVSEGMSWQDARSVIPMGITSYFFLTYNWQSLRGMMGHRLHLCEQPETVDVAWQILDLLYQWSPHWARTLLPACVKAGKCLYSDDGLKSLFSNLHNHKLCPIRRYIIKDAQNTQTPVSFQDDCAIAWTIPVKYPYAWGWLERYASRRKHGVSPYHILLGAENDEVSP